MQDEVINPGSAANDHPSPENPGTPDDLEADMVDPGPSETAEMAVFETFPDREQAAPVLRILDENGIPYVFEENRMGFDPSFANNVLYQAWVLKVPPDRLEELRKDLEEAYGQADVQLPPDHYLRDFSVEELFEVIAKADEWSEFDVVVARQMLDEKGAGLSDDEVEVMRAQRRKELAKPTQADGSMIAAAYLLALLGGVLGVILGWILMNSTKTTAFGDKVAHYDAASQAHGKRALGLGALVAAALVVALVLKPEWFA